MTNDVKLQVFNMYCGLMGVYWADAGTMQGTAKYKSLQHMKTYAKTLDKQNPIAQEIQKYLAQMARSESEKMMNDPNSNLVLDKDSRKQYKDSGEKQAAQAKAKLTYMIEQGRVKGQSMDSTKNMRLQDKAREQDTRAKAQAPQYRANKTNVADKPQSNVGVQQMNQETLVRMLTLRLYQRAA